MNLMLKTYKNIVSFLKNHLILTVVLISIHLISSLVLTNIYQRNYPKTLNQNGQWISTKQNLAMPVMGSDSFMSKGQALAAGHLNLGAWHAFQELIFKRSLRISAVKFDFKLDFESYLIFIFNKNVDTFNGFRLSASKLFDPIFFQAGNSGEFLQKNKINMPLLDLDRWHHAVIKFENNQIRISIDGVNENIIEVNLADLQSIGFRSGGHNVLVDNVIIFQKGNKYSIIERFDHTVNSKITFIKFFLAGSIIILIIVLYLANKKTIVKHIIFSVCVLEGIILVALLAGQVFLNYYFQSPIYPAITQRLRNKVKDDLSASLAKLSNFVRNKYPVTPAPNTYRVLFVGSSQTWGAGAHKKNDIFTRLVEEKLNKLYNSEVTFECINVSIPSIQARQLYEYYEKEWINFNPNIVMINLSNSDYQTGEEDFALSLEQFYRLSQSRGIKIVFILEANTIEYAPNELPKHKIMRQVADKHNIPLLDLHQELKKKYDYGILWWDIVHLTSFGHELAADFIYHELIGLLNKGDN